MEQPTCPYCGEQAYGEWHSYGMGQVQEPAYCQSCHSHEPLENSQLQYEDERITGWVRGERVTLGDLQRVLDSPRAKWWREAQENSLERRRQRYIDEALF